MRSGNRILQYSLHIIAPFNPWYGFNISVEVGWQLISLMNLVLMPQHGINTEVMQKAGQLWRH